VYLLDEENQHNLEPGHFRLTVPDLPESETVYKLSEISEVCEIKPNPNLQGGISFKVGWKLSESHFIGYSLSAVINRRRGCRGLFTGW